MEPLLSFGGLELTLVEIILLLAFALIGAIIAFVVAGSRKDPEAAMLAAQMREKLSEMQAQQGALQGRLSQFAEDSAQRDTMFRQSLDERLSKVSDRVGKSIVDTQERNSANLKQLHERLALIDRAQKNIETLSGEVSGLQSLLSNKQARGAFGEKQMQDLIETYLPPNAFSFQHTLSNGKRVDALIHLPGDQGDVAIDSKFPMEAWRRLTEADNTDQSTVAKRGFASDVTRHINDIADKYLIFGETHDIAMLFLPSEAVYAELHTHFPQVIEHGFTKKVMIVSPTTFMATLHTMRAVMRDAAMREQAHIIQSEVGKMSKDVTRLDERVAKLQSHFNQTTEDMRQIRISTEKISGRADKIESLDLQEREKSSDNIAQFPKSKE